MAKQDLSSQMLKGILQGCLLMLISDEPMYGYSISQALTQFGFQDVPKGTVYPLLINMEKGPDHWKNAAIQGRPQAEILLYYRQWRPREKAIYQPMAYPIKQREQPHPQKERR